MGTMFKLHEFPTVYEIENKFRFNVAITPLPDFQDFRIDLNNAELSALQTEMKQQHENSIKTMETDLFKRLYEKLNKIVERLEDSETSFKDSLFNNLEEVLNELPELNITENKDLTDCIKKAKTAILKDPESIRQDDKLRETVFNEASDLLETISGYADCF
jgi:predicted transcriptional regulator